MSESIVIQSFNYEGEVANIIFKPQEDERTYNLGNHTLPFEFFPSSLTPPRDVYGTYTVLVLDNNCMYVVDVPRPTPTPTPSPTPTKTPTPTPTTTPTPTPTNDPCPTRTPTPTPTPTKSPKPIVTLTPTVSQNPCPFVSPTPTPTKTSTPTPTPTNTPTPTPTSVYFAYLFIEPIDGSPIIGQFMFDNGSNFFGFSNASQPSQNPVDFNFDMNLYVNFSGWTNGTFPTIIKQTVPQTSGGEDLFDNPIIAFNFLTTQVPQNYVGGDAWYTWIIPVNLTNNQKQTIIDLNISNGPNVLTAVATEPIINSFTFNYTGSVLTPGTYRVYTTYPNPIFKITDSQNIYFRGNTISP